MLNILVIGISGFLGKAIATASTAIDLNVSGLSRSDVSDGVNGVTYFVADRSSPEFLRVLVSEQKIDVVVDVLAMTLADTQPLIYALDGSIAQYVMLSSSDVYRNYELLHRKTKGAPTSESVDEESALRTTRFPYRSDPTRQAGDPNLHLDAYDKIPIEEAVRGLSMDWTILRLPMIYGPGDKQRRFRWAIGHMIESRGPMVIPRSWAEWVATYGYVDDVAAGIALTLGNKVAARRTYNIGETAPVDHLQWARRIAEVIGWGGIIEISDDPSIPFAQRLQTIDLSVPFKISSERIRSELGFTEPVSLTVGLDRTIQDERARG